MKKVSVHPMLLDTYLSVLRGSINSKAFKHLYAEVSGKRVDILENGKLSCAFFASSILSSFGLIKSIHATVNGTEKDLYASGWKKIKHPKAGSVLVWEIKSKKEPHRHVGFYVGDKKAVSNGSDVRVPVIHDWTYGRNKNKPRRKVEAILWHKKLG
ncbi:MAG: hypothetical protein A3D47_01130 [Candidatus Colwellbacteria bacterium RIFCSPHIGHO2_02_FULL_43_15]|uniref:NlpC/P60 domain-containing protein n=2 Tax=Candidatus Colwelliibacteriota TaxID=1817904 RepID=A0A1G1Z1K0_9BACT|nr:MAG: hypothetical protein A3D47_01130 [Candidatus Colwellbacteria bacterium RIFCSPHIGHO2_02_FULL_43_15]OGY61260.1 MAG: hypothetical protein A3F99_00560 [Candidatus Colwellbacteria bacterium RIFCSPLOWO2_12_FULL_43_11]